MILENLKNWVIKRLSGYTVEEIGIVFARNLILKRKLSSRDKSIDDYESLLRRQAAKHVESNKKAIANYNSFYNEKRILEVNFEDMRKDYIVQKRGYGKLRTRKFKLNKYLDHIENHSKNFIVKDLCRNVKNILKGEKINDKK